MQQLRISDQRRMFDLYSVYLIAFLTLLPFSSRMIIIRGMVLVSILLLKNIVFVKIKHVSGFKFEKKILLFILLLVMSYLLSVTIGVLYSGRLDFQTVFHEGQRLVFYILAILIASQIKIEFFSLTKILKVLLIFHISIQLLQWFGNTSINSIIEKIYISNRIGLQSTIHLNLADVRLGSSFRSGSIFLNPNVYMVYPLIFFLFFLEARLISSSYKYNYWIFMALISLFLTGSRTSFIVAAVILLLYLRNIKIILSIAVSSVLIVYILIYFELFNFSLQSRWFQVQDGFSSSLGTKGRNLIYYLSVVDNILLLLFGSLGTKYATIQVDMEFGYVFLWFGLIGMSWYAWILKIMIRNYSRFSIGITLIFLLVGLSATIYFNITFFPFFSILIFSFIDKQKCV